MSVVSDADLSVFLMSESVEGQNELSMKFCGSWLHGAAIMNILFLIFFEHNRTPRCS